MKNKTYLTRRQIKALETKKRLFEASILLFAEKGYDEVTIDEIVAKAGTSKGNFYTHFKSKHHVIVEQLKQADSHLTVINNFTSSQTSIEKLLVLIKKQLEYVKTVIGFETFKILYHSQLKNNPGDESFNVDPNRPMYQIINKIIIEGQINGELRDDINHDYLTIMVIRALRGLTLDWCLYNGKFDLIEEGQKFFSIFLDSIKKTS